VLSSRPGRLAPAPAGVACVGGVACVAAVVAGGELSLPALVAVAATGAVVAAVALARRSGEAAPPVGRAGMPWLVCLAAAAAWELLTLVDDDLLTLSDLLDPILARPALRGAATVGWLVAGAWLLSRPRHARPASSAHAPLEQSTRPHRRDAPG